MRGTSVSQQKELPEDTRIASKTNFMSNPAFLHTASVSPIATSCTAQRMLEKILMIVACPNSPQRTMRGAESAINSAICPSSTAGSAPTNVTILPARRICMPPVSGASTALAPLPSTCLRTFSVLRKSVVLCSIHVAPWRIPARIPPSPLNAAVTCSGRGKAVMTISERSAASLADFTHVAPWRESLRARGTFLSPWRSNNVKGTLFLSKFPATAAPNWPTPMIAVGGHCLDVEKSRFNPATL
mmetsp:Transcript_131597/g.281385  ORF Transcript_131597/g.281385 Transcript_131597/m.281385 type:complete len:243 (-) Transcript_131597:11-739(-)